MGIVNPFRTEQDKTHKAARDAVQLGLTNTNPFLIEAGDTTLYTDLDGYAIHALTNVDITAIGTNVKNGDITTVTISAGHVLYIRVKSIQLAAGAALIYQL